MNHVQSFPVQSCELCILQIKVRLQSSCGGCVSASGLYCDEGLDPQGAAVDSLLCVNERPEEER